MTNKGKLHLIFRIPPKIIRIKKTIYSYYETETKPGIYYYHDIPPYKIEYGTCFGYYTKKGAAFNHYQKDDIFKWIEEGKIEVV